MDLAAKELADVELAVTDVVYGGRGLARHAGLVVFAGGVLPGERVRLRITHRHQNYADADLLEVLAPSAQRVAPACPLSEPGRPAADRCPGCTYQHASYEEELRLKHAQLLNLLQRIGKADPAVCLPPIGAPQALGYRNKITLHFRKEPPALSAEGVTSPPYRLGYVAADNVSIVDVPACPIAHPAINAELARLRDDSQFMASFGEARKLTLRCTPRNGVVVWQDAASGGGRLEEQTAIGPMSVPRQSFFQVNPAVADLLLREASIVIAGAGPKTVVDLYCGTGLFGLAAAKAGVPRVIGVDSDAASIRAARANARQHGLDAAEFVAGNAVQELRRFAQAVEWKDAAVIVDPPRSGLERGLAALLGTLRPRLLLYVSCAADTLARDVALLAPAGFRLRSSRVLDMFPRTASFETLSVLAGTSPVS